MGATAVVGAELAALVLSVRLTAAAVDGWVPASASPVPVAGVAVAATGLTVAVRQRGADGTTLVASGVALIVAAPFTAFGGGCGVRGDGVFLFRSGVRIGVAVAECVTFLNGALLVLGYALLAAGLWLAADRLALPEAVGRGRRRTSD